MSSIPKILIAGCKQVGKSTSAKYIKEVIPGTVELTFAEPLKAACKAIFLLSDSQLEDQELKNQIDPRWGVSPRQMLQAVGDLLRIFLPTLLPQLHLPNTGRILTENMRKRIMALEEQKEKPPLMVISDGRFLDEGVLMASFPNAISVKIEKDTGLIDNHQSEKVDIPCDMTISNNGDLVQLRARWNEILTNFQFKQEEKNPESPDT